MIMFPRIIASIVLALSAFLFCPSYAFSERSDVWTNLGLYGGQIADIAIDPVNPYKMFTATYKGDGLFATEDGGSSWQSVEMENDPEYQATFKHHDVSAVSIAPNDHQVIWVTHNYYIARSTDGGRTWTHIDVYEMTWYARICKTIAVDPSDPMTVYVGTSGPNGTNENGAIFKTGDGGDTWVQMNQGADLDFTVVDIDIDPRNNQTIWAVTNSKMAGGVLGGTLYRSGNGGDTWDDIFSLTPHEGVYYAVAVSPNDSTSVFTASEGRPGSDYRLGIIKHFFNGSNWNQVSPYDSDCVLDIAFDPQDDETLYTSSVNSIRRSDDGGETWKTYPHNNIFECLAVPAIDYNVVIGGDLYQGIYLGVYDDGADNYSWTPINDGINAVVVYDVAIDPNDPTHILAGTISGTYEKKAGESWSRILEPSTESILFHPSDSQTFYAGLQAGLAKTVDGGKSWTYWFHDDTFNFIKDIAIDPTNTDRIFIAVAGGDYGEIYKSIDGGDTFNKILDGTNLYGQPYGFNVVAIDPSDPDHLFAGGGNGYVPLALGDLWESTNGGNDWTRTGLQFEFVNALLIDPRDSNVMYAGCGASGGTTTPLYMSTDGGDTWMPSHRGMPGPKMALPGLDGSIGTDLFAVGSDGAILHYDGVAWTGMRSATTEFLWDVWISSNTDVFAAGTNSTILHYDGTSWSAMANPGDPYGIGVGFWGIWGSPSADPGSGLPNDVFAVGDLGTILHFNGSIWQPMESLTTDLLSSVWGSASAEPGTGLANDVFAIGAFETILHYNGSAWEPMDRPTTEILRSVWGSSSVDPGTARANDVFVVGTAGTILHYDGDAWELMECPTEVFLGSVWGSSSVNPGTGMANDVFAVGNSGTILHYDGAGWADMISPVNEDLLSVWGASSTDVYAASGYGTILHYDGSAWTVSNPAGKLYNSVTDLEFHFQNKDVLYAGTSLQGVYVSPDQARNWLNVGTPEYNLYAIATGSLYAATQGGLLQCTGTGLITGRITDASQGNNIDGATVFTDFGVKCISVAGDYMMVHPAGLFSVTATADDYQNSTEQVTVSGGNVSWANFAMESGNPDPLHPPGFSDTSSSGSYCFIATASTAAESAGHADSMRDADKILCCLCILTGGLFVVRQYWNRARIVKGTASKQAIDNMRIAFFALLILAPAGLQAATLFQSVGVASSPNPVGSGARAMGMGGAFIGVADDATAASWNTAGLIQLENPELSIVADYHQRKENYFSSSHSEIDNTGEVDYLELNYFSAAYPFHLYRNMVVSVNFQRLYDFKRRFSHRYDYAFAGAELAQYKEFSQEGSIGALGLAGAVQITPRLSFGTTLNIWTDELLWENGWDETFDAHSVGTQGGAPVTIDTRIEDKYTNFRGINANLGLLWDMTKHLTIGAVVKTPFTASIRHEFRYRQTQTYGAPVDSTSTSNQGIAEDVELDMPLSYGLGLAWRFSDALSIDLDVYRTDWRHYMLTDDQGNEFSPIDGRPRRESRVEDTTQVRLGAEYIVIMQDKLLAIPIRGGLFYDPEPSQGSPNDFYGVAIGSGIAYKRFIVDIAYQLRWGNNVDTGNLIAASKADIIQHTFLSSLIVHF